MKRLICFCAAILLAFPLGGCDSAQTSAEVYLDSGIADSGEGLTLYFEEEEAAAQTRRTLEEFRSRYSKLMSDFEAASGHVNGELRKIEVTLSQLPRALDQTGAQLNELAARLEKKPEEKS